MGIYKSIRVFAFATLIGSLLLRTLSARKKSSALRHNRNSVIDDSVINAPYPDKPYSDNDITQQPFAHEHHT